MNVKFLDIKILINGVKSSTDRQIVFQLNDNVLNKIKTIIRSNKEKE